VRHRLLHLSDLDAIVLPYCRTADRGWLCQVVAARTPRPGPRPPSQVALTDDEIAVASPRLMLATDRDRDGYATLLWPALVFLRWPGGGVPSLARLLVDELRQPGTVHIRREPLDDLIRLALRLPVVRPPAVKIMLARLVSKGFLTPDPAGSYNLTLPASHTDTTAAERVGRTAAAR
jgi:hypothetical protein